MTHNSLEKISKRKITLNIFQNGVATDDIFFVHTDPDSEGLEHSLTLVTSLEMLLFYLIYEI